MLSAADHSSCDFPQHTVLRVGVSPLKIQSQSKKSCVQPSMTLLSFGPRNKYEQTNVDGTLHKRQTIISLRVTSPNRSTVGPGETPERPPMQAFPPRKAFLASSYISPGRNKKKSETMPHGTICVAPVKGEARNAGISTV
jgi:hypothetical protein